MAQINEAKRVWESEKHMCDTVALPLPDEARSLAIDVVVVSFINLLYHHDFFILY